jgi:hypothetical protein
MNPLHSVAQKRGMDPFGRSPCMRNRGPTDLIQRNIPSDAVRSRSDCVCCVVVLTRNNRPPIATTTTVAMHCPRSIVQLVSTGREETPRCSIQRPTPSGKRLCARLCVLV